MKPVQCEYCNRPVRDQDELVTASRRFRVRPFHFQCFSEMEQEASTHRALWIPVNGISGLVTVILMIALAGWMLLTDTLHQLGDLVGIIALYPVILRIYSYIAIESVLPKLIKDKKPLERDYEV
jgi:hypothetical protein